MCVSSLSSVVCEPATVQPSRPWLCQSGAVASSAAPLLCPGMCFSGRFPWGSQGMGTSLVCGAVCETGLPLAGVTFLLFPSLPTFEMANFKAVVHRCICTVHILQSPCVRTLPGACALAVRAPEPPCTRALPACIVSASFLPSQAWAHKSRAVSLPLCSPAPPEDCVLGERVNNSWVLVSPSDKGEAAAQGIRDRPRLLTQPCPSQ